MSGDSELPVRGHKFAPMFFNLSTEKAFNAVYFSRDFYSHIFNLSPLLIIIIFLIPYTFSY